MKTFGEAFRTAYGHGAAYRAFTANDRSRLSGTVPAYLLDLWESDGWAGYRDGLLWTVDPDELAPVVAAWRVPEATPLVAVARTAFGILYLLGTFETGMGGTADAVIGLHPHAGTYSFVGAAPVFLTEVMAQERYISEALREPDVRRAAREQGPLSWNEMYTYEPALALGGSGKPETVRRVNLFAHHAFLAQLAPTKLRLL